MSTRSDIIVHRADGKWSRVYCHFDGYLDGVGVILLNHYNDQEKAEALVAPGDMSSLGGKCDKPEGHSYENKIPGYTVYYGRDRGETNVDAKVGDTLESVWDFDDAEEYSYVFDAGKWWVRDPDNQSSDDFVLTDLAAAIVEEESDDDSTETG